MWPNDPKLSDGRGENRSALGELKNETGATERSEEAPVRCSALLGVSALSVARVTEALRESRKQTNSCHTS